MIFLDENLALVKYEKLSTKEKIILYFFIYAFLGWCLETFYAFTVFGHFVKRGFLLGPICPIYGFGAVLLIINLEKIKENNFKKFIVSMFVFSVFEFIASWVLEVAFHQRWWDYSDAFMNIQGRICLSFSLLWGVIGVLFSNTIHPFVRKRVDKRVSRTTLKTQRIFLYSFVGILLVDFAFSCVKYIM